MVATELTAKDALKAHAEAELGIDSSQQVSPGQAALSSFVSFAGGSLLPLLAITGPWLDFRIQATNCLLFHKVGSFHLRELFVLAVLQTLRDLNQLDKPTARALLYF